MPKPLNHGIRIDFPRDSLARQDFVVALRKYVLNDMAASLKHHFDKDLAPAFFAREGRAFATQDEIHVEMLPDLVFRTYSAVRYNAQEMSWNSVIPDVDERIEDIRALTEQATAGTTGADTPTGSLELDPALEIPENVAGQDVHLMPGGYVSDDPIRSGAIYDNGLTVFTAGLLGKDIDDIGQSMAHYIKYRFPDLRPRAILDCGCTIGHNTVPWAQCFPDTEVHGVDVAGSALRYGHARAESMGVPVHFHQMDATALSFADESFDIVFSSQFLHELSLEDIGKYMAEARRVLRPGGMLITMELPPNRLLAPYDQFFLDWDCYYNHEPYYRAFRDADAVNIAERAGFSADGYFQFTVPQYVKTSPERFQAEAAGPAILDSDTGRLSDDLRYFGFGLTK